jgi:hypothetical protein
MDTPSQPRQTLQWKWVVLTLLLYILLYFLPLIIASGLTGQLATTLVKVWTFGGVVIVSAIAGYISRGVTIWEPAIASALLLVLIYGGFQVYFASQGGILFREVVPFFVYLGAIFGLSLLGAGIGEGLQNMIRSGSDRPSDPTPKA